MAERRMFAKTIIDSDAFCDMPQSTQNLYFHLCMRADDDGFINNPKKIQRMANCSDDDAKLLCAKNFVIPFESGVVVIKHWLIHNLIRADRYKETVYKEELAMLEVKSNKAYTCKDGIPIGNQAHTQVRLGKVSIDKDREENREDRANALPHPKNCKSKKENERHILPSYGEGFPVYLSDEEKAKLIVRYSEPVILDFIEKVSLWQPHDKKRPENDYLTLLNWLRRDKVPEVKHIAKCKKCGGTLATIGDYIGTCFDDECDMYHKEQI